MAQKNNRLLLYGGIAAIALGALVMTEPPKKSASTEEEPTKRSTSSRSTRGEKVSLFTKEDELARFDVLNEPISNAFKPSVVDSGARSAASKGVPNQVPPHFINGESSWFYTGTVSFDGSTMVLIENSSNGQGEYLRVGQTIGNATVMDITNNSVTLAGPNGEVKRLVLMENRPIVDDYEYSSNNAPYNPMQGDIGRSTNSKSSPSNTEAQMAPRISSTNGPTVLDLDNNTSDKDAQDNHR